MVRRRVGFFATLAAGVGLLGASLHGMTSVDRELKLAAAPTPQPSFVQERHDCDRLDRDRHHPEV